MSFSFERPLRKIKCRNLWKFHLTRDLLRQLEGTKVVDITCAGATRGRFTMTSFGSACLPRSLRTGVSG